LHSCWQVALRLEILVGGSGGSSCPSLIATRKGCLDASWNLQAGGLGCGQGCLSVACLNQLSDIRWQVGHGIFLADGHDT
jgi:hypothetical protein